MNEAPASGQGFLDAIVAIDIHTHATVSTRNPPDEVAIAMDAAMDAYFKQPMARPTIAETAAYYRQRRMLAVIFTVDTERETGQARISNEEVAEEAVQHPDALIPFASIDPMRGKMGAREVRRLIKDWGIQGFKFHPSAQGFYPNDRAAYAVYEAIAEAGLPAIFHSGQTGLGAGLPGGSDYPVITPDRWLKDFEALDIRPEVRPLVLKQNAIRLLGLDRDPVSGRYTRLKPPSVECC